MLEILRHRMFVLALLFGALLLRGTAHGESPPPSAEITIGSKNFTENRLLAEIMAQLIEARTELTVRRRGNLGGTTVVFAALRSGDIDGYPEYTGTGWTVHLGRKDRVKDPLRAFLTVQRDSAERFDVQWLEPFGFNNSYAMAMNEAAAQKLNVHTISDLVEHQSSLSAAVSHEFLNREDGYPGLAAAYGLDISDLRGMEHGLAYEAIDSDRVDVVDTWTTDGKIDRFDIRILEDDLSFFPPYDAAPLFRVDTLAAHPEIERSLHELAFVLDDAKMRGLNYRVEEEGGSFEQVAADFLVAQGLLEDAAAVATVGERDEGLFAFLWSRRSETLGYVGQHVFLTLVAVVLAILFAVPLGIVLTRHQRWAPTVMGAAGVIQTVPSLALLAFLIPVPGFGLGARSAIAALFLYALLPILRNTFAGIEGVDRRLVEAGLGLGLRDRDILWRVQLPLAMQTVMAGIRTATVISIGVATLAAFIGAGGLGDPIVTGLQLNDTLLILSGAVPAAVLAILADIGLGLVERRLVPKGL